MGLTIYYEWKTKADYQAARRIVATWHALAQELPFDEVSDIYELDSPDGASEFLPGDDVFKHGDLHLPHKRSDGAWDWVFVRPEHVVQFYVYVNGAESAAIGLASHPPVVVHCEDVIERREDGSECGRRSGQGNPIEFPTWRRGYYSWHSSCKTQYAANPKLGGESNFLRAHLSLIELFDQIRAAGVRSIVRDDSGYAKHRDVDRLLASLRDWNAIIARFAGTLSDALGDVAGECVAPIMDRPDFEHLEADGIRVLK